MMDNSKALRDIAAERRRQIEVERWTHEHDDGHDHGELSRAAVAYAAFAAAHESSHPGIVRTLHDVAYLTWPWGDSWFKPKDARSNLIRAAALIVAEIERLDRQEG